MARILVVEDEPRLRKIISDYLKARQFQVIESGEGLSAVRKVQEEEPDLVVLDIMLPGIDGIEAAGRIRRKSSIPIIMLTARGDEEDKLKGFAAGTDDYMVKPFSLRELEARIGAALKRSTRTEPKEPVISHLGFTVDPEGQRVTKDDIELPLTSLQFRLLQLFLKYPGVVFSRDDILEHLRDDNYDILGRTVDAHIKNVRKIIEPDPARPRFLLTRWGAGYLFARE